MKAEFQHIDLGYLERMTEGDRTLQKQMLAVLIRELQTEIPRLQALAAAASREELRQVSHRFRTTLDYLGHTAMRKANREIEHIAESGAEWEKLSELVARLETLAARVLPELEQALAARREPNTLS